MPRVDRQVRQWIEPTPIEIPAEITALGLPAIVAEMLVRRGIVSAAQARAFLDPAAYTPADPFDLPDMAAAIDRLERALRDHELILVWGDFDVDGQTSTALLVSALSAFGAVVNYHIPHRDREGHGIDLTKLADLLDGGRGMERPGLLLTCDTGITAHDAIRLAGTYNVDVIVTDHHNLPETLPPALANINPQRLPRSHPLATLPGVGTAYELIAALVMRLGPPSDRPDFLNSLTDLVALGIVADVALQTGDARWLLQTGLAQIRATPRPGIAALIELARIDPAELGEEQIGFALAPRLNALGRLADAAQGVELLLSVELSEARVRAVSVEQLNAYRKLLSDQTFAAAVAQVEKDSTLLDSPILVLGNAAWSPGVVGIVANRLVEMYNRPVFLFGGADVSGAEANLEVGPTISNGAKTARRDNGSAVFKGSARSTAGIDVTAALTRVDAESPGLLLRFGGHTMAAGVSIAANRLGDFRFAINRAIKAMGITAAPAPTLDIGAFVRLDQVTLELADAIGQLAPFGPGNPPLTLAARNVTVRNRTSLGQGAHLRMMVQDDAGNSIRILWWNGVSAVDANPDLLPEVPFDVAFTARSHSWKGRREIQLEWRDSRVQSGIARPSARPLEVIDLRKTPDPVAALREVLAHSPQAAVYAEANVPDDVQPYGWGIGTQHTLVIWTPPYSRFPFRQLMRNVQPQQIVFLCVDPELDRLEPFMFRLAGLVKYAIQRKEGEINVYELARAMAHNATTVIDGLAWLSAKGVIDPPQRIDDERYLIDQGSGQTTPDLATVTFALQAQLAETAAYRQYLRSTDAEALKRQLIF
ncbi:MAG: DHH family phosphoesterase [Anaerolineae bacterium]